MLQDRLNNSADTEGWLNDPRNVLFFLDDFVLFTRLNNHALQEFEFLAFDLQDLLIACLKVLKEIALLLLVHLSQVFRHNLLVLE